MKLQLLVVDDDVERSAVVHSMLENSPEEFDVLQAFDCIDAIQRLSAYNLDCIVLNQCISVEPCLAAISRFRAFSSRLPVVVVAPEMHRETAKAVSMFGSTTYLDLSSVDATILSKAIQTATLINHPDLLFQKEKNRTRRILLIDENTADNAAVEALLRQCKTPMHLDCETNVESAFDQLREEKYDCVVNSAGFENRPGFSTLERLNQMVPDVPVILVASGGSEELVVQALKQGAAQYLSRSYLSSAQLSRSLEEAIQSADAKKATSQRDEERGYFLNTLVHDLRGPLQNLMATSDLLQKSVSTGDHVRVQKLFELQERTIQHTAALLDHLAEFALLEHEIELELVDFQVVLEQVCQNLSGQIAVRRVNLEVSRLPCVLGQPAQLVQLFQNIVQNGIKYGNDTAPSLAIKHHEEHKDFVYITVTDNGVGIDQSHLETIFEPLKRGDDALQKEGSGLGLAICKKIVALHGGEIWCTSIKDVGSTFHIVLRSGTSQQG